MKEESKQEFFGWEDFNPKLEDIVVNQLKTKFKFDRVSKVQKTVIPLFLSNKDVCVKACTGSGKTLAFSVPLVQTLIKLNESIKTGGRSSPEKHEVVALILAPARELAV